MKFPSNLKRLRDEKHITQEQLSKALGISKSSKSMYEQGNREPDFETLEVIADYFNVDMNHLLGKKSNVIPLPKSAHRWSDPLVSAYASAQHPTREAVCNVLQIPYVQPDEEPKPTIVPTATFPSAAGIPVWVGNGEMDDKEYPPGVVPKGTSFAIRIAGDSMEPTIPDGSYVFVRQQPDIRNNEIGVFMIQDEAACKRYYKDKDGVKLLSDNPKYCPRAIANDIEGFGLVGKVVGHWLPE